MKVIEKLVLILYSLLMLVISGVLCLVIFRVIDTSTISNWINYILDDSSLSIIALGVAVLFILLSVRCIFFRKKKKIKKSTETDILLENDSGRLLISKRAIENSVKNVINEAVKTNPEIKVTVDIDPASNISTYISIILDKSVKVREFSVGLQSKIKERIKEDFDLEVKQVNIKIDSAEKVEIKKEIKNEKEEVKVLEADTKDIIEVKPEVTSENQE